MRVVTTRLTSRPARIRACLACAVLALAGCGGGDDAPPGDASTTGTRGGGAMPTTPADGGPPVLEPFVQGLQDPVQVVPLPDGDGVLVAEQRGAVRLIRGGAVQTDPVLDVSGSTKSGGEQGLLSIALHPDFPTDPRVYVHRSDARGDTLVEEYRFTDDRIGPAPTRKLLSVRQPHTNHNGGSLAFGADGLLYLGLGDGGAANDPDGNAQNLDSRLGKLLRLEIDRPGADWEIAAYGLRNPWRAAFDPATGDLWIGDVGQGRFEEVDVFPRDAGLINFGWDAFEGRERVSPGLAGRIAGTGAVTEPVAVYSHDEGCSITGGVVVRDDRLASLKGRYVFGDYCSGAIWSIPAGPGPATPRREPVSLSNIVSFDTARDGTVYLTSRDGTVSRLGPS